MVDTKGRVEVETGTVQETVRSEVHELRERLVDYVVIAAAMARDGQTERAARLLSAQADSLPRFEDRLDAVLHAAVDRRDTDQT